MKVWVCTCEAMDNEVLYKRCDVTEKELIMSKEQKTQKEDKKKAKMSLKEKRKAKQEKRGY